MVGSRNSSNSNRLREIAEAAVAHLVDGPDDIRREWLTAARQVGVTAGASAPEVIVQQVVARLREWGGRSVTESLGIQENTVFALPRELRKDEPRL